MLIPFAVIQGKVRFSCFRFRSPDSCQCGLVLDAVKAWPGSARARRTRAATASLDGVSTRGQWRVIGRDEETGFPVKQRNRSLLPVSLFDRRPFLRPDLPRP